MNGRKVSTSAGVGEESTSAPVIEVDDEIREYADAATLTDPVDIRPVGENVASGEASTSTTGSVSAVHDHPPAYTAQPDPIDEKEVLDRAHPRQRGHGGDADGNYALLVEALGMRCTQMEEKLLSDKAERVKNGLGAYTFLLKLLRLTTAESSNRSTFLSRHPNEAAVINNIVNVTTDVLTRKAGLCLLGAFACKLRDVHCLGCMLINSRRILGTLAIRTRLERDDSVPQGERSGRCDGCR